MYDNIYVNRIMLIQQKVIFIFDKYYMLILHLVFQNLPSSNANLLTTSRILIKQISNLIINNYNVTINTTSLYQFRDQNFVENYKCDFSVIFAQASPLLKILLLEV